MNEEIKQAFLDLMDGRDWITLVQEHGWPIDKAKAMVKLYLDVLADELRPKT